MIQKIRKYMAARSQRQLLLMALAAAVIVALALSTVGSKKRALAASFEKFLEADSYHAEAMLDMKLPARQNVQRPQGLVDVTFGVEGDVAEQDGQPVFVGSMRNEARGRGMILFADGDLRLLPDSVAFRLENLPALLNPKGNLTDKWTHIGVGALETHNAPDVQAALAGLIETADFVGRENLDGEDVWHYRLVVTAEEEMALTELFRQKNSGNRSLNIIARLMRAYELGSLDIWIDPDEKELFRVASAFVRPQSGGELEEMANLTLEFSDYGKEVAVEEPPKELTVKPEVFGRMFGSGDLQGL